MQCFTFIKDLIVIIQGLAIAFKFASYEIILCDLVPLDTSKKSLRAGKYIPEIKL